jgi:hypothetical protein
MAPHNSIRTSRDRVQRCAEVVHCRREQQSRVEERSHDRAENFTDVLGAGAIDQARYMLGTAADLSVEGENRWGHRIGDKARSFLPEGFRTSLMARSRELRYGISWDPR